MLFQKSTAAARFRPMFVADWVDAIFIHYAVAPGLLGPHVPFELDTRDGVAYVSLVAFTQRGLRPSIGGRLAAVLSTPLACHEFLNVRTYVRDARTGERGIYFMAEWIPNRLAALIGPPVYGLPYRVGRLRYRRDLAAGTLGGVVAARGGQVAFEGRFDSANSFGEARDGSLDAFLVERYTAWTHRHGVARRFRIRHAPWPQARAEVSVLRSDLLAGLAGGTLVDAQPSLAHVSPGTFDVAIGPPQRVTRPT
jgi:uncharacterized protein YqjF (DUF2071 family)